MVNFSDYFEFNGSFDQERSDIFSVCKSATDRRGQTPPLNGECCDETQ